MSRLFCCNHTCYCINMVSDGSVTLYNISITSPKSIVHTTRTQHPHNPKSMSKQLESMSIQPISNVHLTKIQRPNNQYPTSKQPNFQGPHNQNPMSIQPKSNIHPTKIQRQYKKNPTSKQPKTNVHTTISLQSSNLETHFDQRHGIDSTLI